MDRLKVFLPNRPGVHNTAGKTHLYDSFADFVEAVQQPTTLADSTSESKKTMPYFVGGSEGVRWVPEGGGT